MAILCSGSVAVDHIMVYGGCFQDVILPGELHVLNVAFHVPELRRTFGGCAANIAYNLRLLGEEPILLAAVGGADFGDYAAWLDRHGIRRDHLLCIEGAATAGAYIITDQDGNQITGFHPGAMDRAHEAGIESVAEPVEIGVVSPNGKRAMVEHARGLKARGTPVLIDPGQGLPLLTREELVEFIEGAAYYVVNDYEWRLTLKNSGLSEAALLSRVGAAIITSGAEGSLLCRGGERERVPALPAQRVVDPTGCGDAYRAGLLHGLRQGFELSCAARMGSLLGALQVECPGTQGLRLTPEDFIRRYRAAFGEPA